MRNNRFIEIIMCLFIAILILLPKQINTIGPIPIRTLITYLVILITLYLLYKKKIELNDNPIIVKSIIYMIFILLTIPSIFVSKNILVTLYTIIKFVSFYLIFLLFYKIKYNPQEYKNMLKTFTICSLIIAAIAITKYALDWNLVTAGIDKYAGAIGRTNATFFNTIYLGVFINIVFVTFLYLYNKNKNTKITLLYAFLCICLSIALILTFTRSTILVYLGILFLLLLLTPKLILNYKTIMLGIVILFIALVIPGTNSLIKVSVMDAINIFTTKENIQSLTPGTSVINPDKNDSVQNEDKKFDDISLEHRQQFAAIAKKIYINNKFTGVGFGAYIDYVNSDDFVKTYPSYKYPKEYPHNSLILLKAETGKLSTIFFIIFILILFLNIIKLMWFNIKKNKEKYQLSVLAFIIITGFSIVCIMSENLIYDNQIFPILLITIGLYLNYINSQKTVPQILFISSTGGHLDELLQLKPMFENYKYHLITEKTQSTLSLKDKYPNKVNYLIFGTKDHKLTYPFKFIFNCILSLYYYIKIKPDYIITTGTHTAVPICYIGKFFNSKIIFIETFANIDTKTLSGTIIYPIANLFLVQWPNMQKLYRKSKYVGWIY